MKITIAMGLIALSVAGCSGGAGTIAAPNLFNGKYYMAGDSTCTQISQISDGRVMCYNPAGEQTGYRDAMTDQQLEMYRHNQQMQLMQQQQAAQQSAQFAQQMASWSQPAQQGYPQYPAPQLAPIALPGSGQIRCINTGLYTNCRY